MDKFLVKRKRNTEEEEEQHFQVSVSRKKQIQNAEGLSRLLLSNNTKESRLRITENKAGFVVDGEVFPGCTRLLHRLFYRNFREFKERRRSRTSSTKALGETFHRQVAHALMCTTATGEAVGKKRKKKNTSNCSCLERFGSKARLPRKGSRNEKYLSLLLNYLRENNYICVYPELVVSWKEAGCATALDLLCTDNKENPKKILLVELKTGYAVQRDTPRTKEQELAKKPTPSFIPGVTLHRPSPSSAHRGMFEKCVHDVPNTFANHHQLQLWFGVEALRSQHSVEVDRAVVVYFHTDSEKRHKMDVRLESSWWKHDKKRRAQMRQVMERFRGY